MTLPARHGNRREFLKTVGIGAAVFAAATRARGAKVNDKPSRPGYPPLADSAETSRRD